MCERIKLKKIKIKRREKFTENLREGESLKVEEIQEESLRQWRVT